MQIYGHVNVHVKKHAAFYMYAQCLVLIRPNVNMAKVRLKTHNYLSISGDPASGRCLLLLVRTLSAHHVRHGLLARAGIDTDAIK